MQKFALNPKLPWANFAAVPRCCQKPRLFAFGANLEMSDNSPVIYLLGGLPRRAGGRRERPSRPPSPVPLLKQPGSKIIQAPRQALPGVNWERPGWVCSSPPQNSPRQCALRPNRSSEVGEEAPKPGRGDRVSSDAPGGRFSPPEPCIPRFFIAKEMGGCGGVSVSSSLYFLSRVFFRPRGWVVSPSSFAGLAAGM